MAIVIAGWLLFGTAIISVVMILVIIRRKK